MRQTNAAAPTEGREKPGSDILAVGGLSREEWLRARFSEKPHQECEWCFRGASLHDVEFDRGGEPVIICVTANGYRR